ncbi:MAG: hypothetical protein GY862_14845 [Gammaproteobacteria bacterium]|nr:hypothetical protein [Gammaproteobacteria bacterium]
MMKSIEQQDCGISDNPDLHKIAPMYTEGWGEYYKVIAGELEYLIIPAAGGRVIPLTFNGKSMVRYDEAKFGKLSIQDVSAKSSIQECIEKYTNLGGRVVWLAPQNKWEENGNRRNWPPPTAFEGKWELASFESDSMMLTSEHYKGLQISQHIFFTQKNSIKTVLTVENLSEYSMEDRISIWTVTQFMPSGYFELLTDKNTTIDIYDDFHGYNTSQELEDGGVIEQQEGKLLVYVSGKPSRKDHVKFGVSVPAYSYVLDGVTYTAARFGDGLVNEIFPHGKGKSPVEIYINPGCYAEGELTSPLKKLDPKEKFSVTELINFING